MKVLLVDPASFGDLPGAMQPNLSFGYLASTLLQNNICVQVYDMRLGYSLNDLNAKLSEYNPDLVGVTTYSVKFNNTLNVINAIIDAGFKIVVGGPHVSAVHDDVMEKTQVDFGVYGEGEFTLLELCNTIEAGTQEYDKIEGLIWRNGDKIIENSPRSLFKDLDALPFPGFEIFELSKYTFYEEKRLPVITSRGCPYGCVFCSVRLSMGNHFRFRSPENVIQEIDHWYAQGWRQFDIQDDCFSFDMDRAKKILDLIIERDYDIKILLGNGIRVDRVDEELLVKLKKAGCTYLQYGIESGDNDTLRQIRKGITVEKALHTLEITRKVGIETSVNFIIGLPGETPEKAMNTIRLAEKLEKEGELINIYNLVPYPGTDAFTYAMENGRFTLPVEEYLSNITYGTDNPVFETDEFTYQEREKILKHGLSIARRSWLRVKLGKNLGYMFWWITSVPSIYNFFTKLALGSKMGRAVYNFVKKD